MQLVENIRGFRSDYWEERANKVLSHFNYAYPDEIDIYDICWQYGVQIKPLDEHFFPGEITDELKAFSIPKAKDRRGVIFIRPELDALEKKLLLAEEFCHVYAHQINQLHTDSINLNKTENQAKRMAAFLLMPQRFLADVIEEATDQYVLISALADYFLVTEEFALYRLGLLFKQQKVDMLANANGRLVTIERFD